MKEKEIIDKLKELQNDSFEWQGGEDLIDFIKNLKKENEELQKENEELREITNGYNSLKKDSETFGGIPLIIANEKYFNEGIFTTNFIPKDKIRELLENNYDISTENSRSISIGGAFAFVDDIEELLEEE